jgi:hypothetical protein
LLLKRPAVQPFLGPLDEAAFSYRWNHPDPRMDALHQDVTQFVEAAAKTDEDPALTFERLWALASALRDGRQPVAVERHILAQRSRPPRLTEPWFC